MAINFDYNKAMGQANGIDNIASNLERIGKYNLQQFIENVSDNWSGENSQQFIKYCRENRQNIINEAKVLRSIAKKIRRTAKIYKEAEDEAIRVQSEVSDGISGGGGASGGF